MFIQTGNTIVKLEDISCLSRKGNLLYFSLNNGSVVKEEFTELSDSIKEFVRVGVILFEAQDNLEGIQGDTVKT